MKKSEWEQFDRELLRFWLAYVAAIEKFAAIQKAEER